MIAAELATQLESLTKLRKRYQEVVRRYVDGQNPSQISREMTSYRSAQGVSNVLQRPEVKQAIADLTDLVNKEYVVRKSQPGLPQAADRLKGLADPAVAALEEFVLDRDQPKLRLDAAKDILNRNGVRAPETRITVQVPIDPTIVAEIAKVLKEESEWASAQIVDTPA